MAGGELGQSLSHLHVSVGEFWDLHSSIPVLSFQQQHPQRQSQLSSCTCTSVILANLVGLPHSSLTYCSESVADQMLSVGAVLWDEPSGVQYSLKSCDYWTTGRISNLEHFFWPIAWRGRGWLPG